MNEPSSPIKSRRWLIIAIVIASIVVLSSGGVAAWMLLAKQTTPKTGDKAAVKELTTELKKGKVAATALAKQRVVSSLGFSFEYAPDNAQARGQVADSASDGVNVSGEEFEGDDLKTERPYSLVKIRQKSATSLIDPTMTIITNIRASFWDRYVNEPDFANRKSDILVKALIARDETRTASEIKTVKINDVEYRHVVLSQDNTKYGVARASQTQLYATVQKDRPYWVWIDDTAGNAALAEIFEDVLASISYGSVDNSKLSMRSTTARVAAVDLPEDTSNTLKELDSDTIIPVVLQNQPAVVRILSVRCGEVSLKYQEHAVTLPKSCGGGVGSGSFISSDGYIATNGHVVTIDGANLMVQAFDSMETVQSVMDFLVKTGSVTSEQITTFLEALRKGDSSALAALAQLPQSIDPSMISVRGDNYQYGVQTSNQPMRMENFVIKYDATILRAKLIDMDFDPITAAKALRREGAFTTSDVAILKVDGGGVFPTVRLAQGGALDRGDGVTAIGYPAFVDDSVDTTKWQTVPTITQGSVKLIDDSATSGGRIIGTSVKAAPGNSGGPAFTDEGEQAGLVTYSMMPCSDQRCFGNGSMRDIEDIHALVRKNGIKLEQGKLTSEWTSGLGAFADGDYQKALRHFDLVKREYPANYLAPELSRVARSKIGSSSDTSGAISSTTWIIIAAVALAVVGLTVIIALSVLLVRENRRQRTMQFS